MEVQTNLVSAYSALISLQKLIARSCAVAVALLSITTSICSAQNPIVQTIYTADPAPMVHDGVFYVYTGHDEDYAGGWFLMDDWRCYASTDMANWLDLGSPLDLNTFSWAQSDAWAAHCTYRNGKFYFYATVKPRQYPNGWAIGVAVADNPAGPFTDAIGGPLVYHTGTGYIDPTVFIDDDGQAYMYWGNPGLWTVRLNADMISTSGPIVEMPQNAQTVGNMYAEAPWLYKRNGTYYLVFATDDTGEQSVAYSTSSSPTGPWAFRGKIMNPSGTSWTLHPGITDYKGNSYIVYHNGALPGGDPFHRSVCVDRFTYNSDGSIPMIYATSSGPPQIGSLNPYNKTEAELINWASGVETEVCSEGGMNVSHIENGDYIKVKGVNFGTAASSFEARVASNSSGGNIELRLDSPTGSLVGTCVVSNTGGWQNWVTRSCNISGASGVHDLYLVFRGGGGSLLNFNWWQFSGSGVGDCDPTSITPYVQVNNGTWQQTSSITVSSGAQVRFGPQPVSGGSWSWSGCGTSGSSREQTVSPTGNCVATAIYTNTCGAQSTQTFTVTVSGGGGTFNGVYSFVAQHSGKAIDVSAGGTTNGTNVQQWAYVASNNNERFQVTHLGSGWHRISPIIATGQALDVSGISTANGANIHTWQWLGGNNQQWRFESAGNGYWKMIARHSNKCLDVSGVSTADGANIHQWDCIAGAQNQAFQMIQQTSARFALNDTEILSNPSDDRGFAVYPNPSSGGDFTVNVSSENSESHRLTIFSADGKKVYEAAKLNPGPNEISTNLVKGMYFIKVDGANYLGYKKLMVK